MNALEFLSCADALLQTILGDVGFQRVEAGEWNRRRGEEIHVVWIQKHSTEASVCVNLGVHFSFLPKVGSESCPLNEGVKLPDCEIKVRLTEDSNARDQWWPISNDSVQRIAALIGSRGLVVLDAYQLGGGIESISVRDVEAGRLGPLLGMTRVRACLFLARLHQHLGNRVTCIEIAEFGIKIAGVAVGPKVALRQILRSYGALG